MSVEDLRQQTEGLPPPDTLTRVCADEPGPGWIAGLAAVLGNPFTQFRGNNETQHQFATFDWSTGDGKKVIRLRVMRPGVEQSPRFRADLYISPVGNRNHPLEFHLPSIEHFIPDINSRQVTFVSKNSKGDLDFTLKLSREGKLEFSST